MEAFIPKDPLTVLLQDVDIKHFRIKLVTSSSSSLRALSIDLGNQ